jgi:hypothetical protein
MYSGNKYLFQQDIKCRSNYIELSGGFPHSEIHGSKLVLSSPWLIAEYHVFHRLLLPRHPPNALLALDLIQKKTSSSSDQKHVYFTHSPDPCSVQVNILVSVLDLDNVTAASPCGQAVYPSRGINQQR